MAHLKKTTLHIRGMHCPSCDILITDKFKEVSNVKEVKANFRKQTAEVNYVGTLDKDKLNSKIRQYGYVIGQGEDSRTKEPLSKRLMDGGAIAIILFIIFFFAQELNLIPSFALSGSLSFVSVFILGLIASTSTCMATSGALFLATIGKNDSEEGKIIPALSFNVGRVLSYGAFGFVVGALGKALILNSLFGSFLTLFVAVWMVIIGLDIAKIVSLSSILTFPFTKGLFQTLESKFIQNPKKTAFLLGVITYLLPCGFTQTVQVYALGLADPVKSALIMMTFALGTVPALMAVGFASSFTKKSWYPTLMKTMGVVVFLLGVGYFTNFLALYGFDVNVKNVFSSNRNLDPNVSTENGVQIARMNVNSTGYSPNSFTVKKNLPVKWIINGENVFGCQGFLQAPKLAVTRVLQLGENVIEFTPKEEGFINFSCSMGMFRGAFNVVSS